MIVVVDDDQESPAKYLTAVITAQPANAVGVLGGQVSFTFSFGAVIPAEFTLQWQIQTDGVNWGDLTETTGYYEGVTTTTLTVKALDNFLASRTSRNFRCRLLFAGSVPSFTNPASLTIPIHTNWSGDVIVSAAFDVGGPAVGVLFMGISSATGIVVSGISGPFTYTWNFISGDPSIVLATPTSAQPAFFYTPGIPAGLFHAVYTCTVSNGVDTIDSDPIDIFLFGVSPPDGSIRGPSGPADQWVSLNGAALGPIFTGFFTGPYSIMGQRNTRRGATAAATIDTPALATSTFSLNGPNLPGTAVSCFLRAPTATPNAAMGFAAAVWLG